MTGSTDPITRGSTAVRTARRLRERVLDAAEDSRAVELVRSVQTGPAGAVERDDVGGGGDDAAAPADEPDTETTQADAVTDEELGAETSPAGTARATPAQRDPTSRRSRLLREARVFRLVERARRVGTSSWLYQWLTAEPDPEVIVIDLRDTWTAGPVLARLDEAIRELLPATVTSGVVRAGYRLRNRFRERPVRVVSIATIAFVLVSFLVVALSEGPVGPELFVLLGLLVAAIRGTFSTRSWADVVETRWYQWLQEAFEPPEPPERAAGAEDDRGSAVEDASNSEAESAAVAGESPSSTSDAEVGRTSE